MQLGKFFSTVLGRLKFQVYSQILVFVFLVFYLIYSESSLFTIKNLSQTESNKYVVGFDLLGFVSDKITADSLRQDLINIKTNLDKTEMNIIDSFLFNIDSLEQLKIQNSVLSTRIFNLTRASIKNSNIFISQTSARLANPEKENSVSNLERAVIAGAANNTNLNYLISEFFLKLQDNIAYEDSILPFIDKTIKNAQIDAKRLDGTPFANLPINAIRANKMIKSNVIEYIKHEKAIDEIKTKLLLLEEKLKLEIEKEANAKLYKKISSFTLISLVIVLLILILGLVSIIFSRSLDKNLGKYIISSIKTYDRIGIGEFSTKELVSLKDKNDEIGKLSSSLHDIVEKLKRINDSTNQNMDIFSSSAESINQSAGNLSKNTAQEATSMEETSAAIEEMTSNLEAMAQNANGIKLKVKETNTQIQIISNVVKKSSDLMSHTIKKSLVIKDISRKVDILAINAAIEAARAGEKGLGFSVIAEEIRKLADLSQQSATEIEGVAIKGEKEVRNSSLLAAAIVPVMNKMFEGVVDLTSSIDEIKSGAGQISSSTAQLNNSTQENAQLAEELSQTAESLSSQVKEMDKDRKLFYQSDENIELDEDEFLSEKEAITNDESFENENSAQEFTSKEIEEEIETEDSHEEIDIHLDDKENDKKDDEFEKF